jgi:dTDP-4-dehydrorhamnose reductase
VKVLITGAAGQLGRALVASAARSATLTALTHRDLDIGDASAVAERIARERPDLIINAAAYTAVDRAEGEPQLAVRVNAEGPRHLARSARSCSARLLHVSTDYVFDGKASTPYTPAALAEPLNIYGSSKRAGELAVLEEARTALVVRTSWLYAPGSSNFLATMLRLMRERGTVRVVTDQVGTPTAAESVAGALWALAERPDIEGIQHWTDAGIASWYDFACAIKEEASRLGLLSGDARVEPIMTREYPTAARRPAYSVLDSSALHAALGVPAVHWRARLRAVLEVMARG